MRLPILAFHAIGDSASPGFAPWVIDRALFGEQLDVLASLGLRGVSIAELLEHPGPGLVGLSFDDAYEDFATAAAPELAERGFGATLFVPSAFVGQTARWLGSASEPSRPIASWEQLRHVDDCGFEIGSHSHTHPQLDILDPALVATELRQSRRILTEELGHPIAGFCYPHGFHRPAVRQAVIDAGYSYACAVKNEMSHVDDDRFALARIVMSSDVTPLCLRSLVGGQDLRLATPGTEKLRTKAFRVARRLQAARR